MIRDLDSEARLHSWEASWGKDLPSFGSPGTSALGTQGTGLKYDGGKAPVYQGLFKYFPRALKAVANVSGYGFTKYKSWGGWVNVPDGENRYGDAVGRHTLDEQVDGLYDAESDLLHAAQRAWNALAVLELMLRRGVPEKNPKVANGGGSAALKVYDNSRKEQMDLVDYHAKPPGV